MENLSINENIEVTKGLQIIRSENHEIGILYENWLNILDKNETILQDHNVVIVSIAGAFRKGKSLLMNFFLKYLNAQYKKHDVSDWVGEMNNDEKLSGFDWRGGLNPGTIGLCIWPEFFTHEYSNGEKVAIILLDTQGLFDNESSMKDCIATFAISMMVSSAQCFNVMQQVQENDLEYLDLFTAYAKRAMEESESKPFQKLLFILRDWPYPDEIGYGYSTEYVKRFLELTSKQTNKMHELRERIRSSFSEIDAFLMPDPGSLVSKGRCTKLTDIDDEFIKYVKELVPSLLAPEKLIVKEVNGIKWKPYDFAVNFMEYAKMFNGKNVPEPESMFMATARANNTAIVLDCYKCYEDLMEERFRLKCESPSQPFFLENELQETHNDMKLKTMSKFREKRKMGGDDMIIETEKELEDGIEGKYNLFKESNERNKSAFLEMARAELEGRLEECLPICFNLYVSKMNDAFDRLESYFSEADLLGIHETASLTSVLMISSHCEDVELLSTFKQKLVDAIREKFTYYQEKNNSKKAYTWAKYAVVGSAIVVGGVAVGAAAGAAATAGVITESASVVYSHLLTGLPLLLKLLETNHR